LFEKARKLLNETLRKLIQKRRQSGRREGGLLGVLLGAKDHEKLNQLSDSQIADNIIGVIFAAHDTTASVLTWILKYLHDNPDLLEAVTVNISHVNLTPSLLINFLLLPFFYHSLEHAFYYFE
jgi:cytochrome P450